MTLCQTRGDQPQADRASPTAGNGFWPSAHRVTRSLQGRILVYVAPSGKGEGTADGLEPVSIVHGVFSTRTRLDARRRVKDFPYRGEVLVIDAITSNPGAPGSALVNLDGELVGMIGRVLVSNLTHTHFNHAMPRDVLHQFVIAAAANADGKTRASRQETAIASGWDTGIRLVRTGYQKVLPFVERVRQDSPAQRADVRRDDLILSVNGRKVPDVDAYDECIAILAPHEAIDLVVRRGRLIKAIHIEPEGK